MMHVEICFQKHINHLVFGMFVRHGGSQLNAQRCTVVFKSVDLLYFSKFEVDFLFFIHFEEKKGDCCVQLIWS
jgi:hypothetical protein